MKKGVLVIMILIFIAGSMFATGSKEGAKEEKKEFITIKGSQVGGTWYAGCAAWAKLITDNTKYIATNVASPGITVENITRMMEGKAQLGYFETPIAHRALNGQDDWKQPVQVRALFGIWPGVYNMIVHEKLGVKDLYGLKGKTVATLVEGDPTGETFMELLAMHGITPQTAKILRIQKTDAVRMFIDEKLDFMVYAFGHGHSQVKEMSTARKIKFITGDPKHMQTWLNKYPFYYLEMFGKEFGVTEELQLVGPYVAGCLASLPDDQAYLFTKVWWENYDYLMQALPNNMPHTNRTNPMAGIPIPIHPGAEKYFKEIGVMK